MVDCRGYDVSFANSAGYVARLTIFYDGQKAESGSLLVGQRTNFHLDCNVGAIRVVMQYHNGFGWKTLYDQTLAPNHYCFKASGTLFNPSGGPCQ